ncbi:pimeloyl-ACP methyl ester carboxylesterase [Glaciihabitans tibetensis]|uniref:Pimeloyl-ACP methyl ester carboxylesterase n=1 Tax=Glaciihabitans tibetensis TaxID=1266600 RepID=A0A2T0V9Y1_9MICO|nr:alpha/beta hydrolase [Glaciihabitans tibetensis]PRY66999.1 pimeloyl-ACP methyl ester carboxylesterase [Glaciihabitans tibetensis]
MSQNPVTPDTIVLIHGLWMTRRSWELWVPYYEAQGYKVITPTYPGFEIEVEALRESPDLIAHLTVPETVDYIAAAIEKLDRPPIIMGHSFGGTLTQLLAARGLGAAAVAINSAPTEGVYVTPPSQIKSFIPIIANPAKHHGAAGYTADEFHYTFTNTLTKEESDKVYNRYHIPAPGNWVWAYGVLANYTPGKQETWVDYSLDERAPLLFIAGGADHIMPPAVNKANAKHYKKSAALTEYHEFAGRSHWTCGEPGWEAVADYALEWALKHASTAHIAARETA